MRGYLTTSNWIVKLQPKHTTVGRDKDSHLCLLNGGVDEHHATIVWNEAEHCYVLSDLNSVHGTYVNGCRIHNAAVRLAPGDELHFGYGGSAYQLLMDTSDPLPVLPAQSAVPPARVRSRVFSPPVTPHPPCRPRPASAGAKRTNLGPKAAELRGHFQKAGCWTVGSGRELSLRALTSSHSSNSIQDLFQNKEGWLRCGENPNCALVGEAQKNDCVIAALREEVASLQQQLSQSGQSDLDIRHKLSSLAKDIQEKKEEIQQLKEQMLEMQRSSGELVLQGIADRDQTISRLRAQLNNLKGECSKSAALSDSLQKDLLAREKQAVKLAAEVDRLRQDMRHKDAQLSNMSTKLSKMKETEKRQEGVLAREKEVESLKKAVQQLEVTLGENGKELKKRNTETASLKHRVEQMTQENASLQSEVDTLKVLQQQTHQREQSAQTEQRHTQTKLENLRTQIIKRMLLSKSVSEQELLEHLSGLAEQKELFRSRMQEMEQKLQELTENQRMVEEDTEKLKTRLVEYQSHVEKVFTMDSLKSQISALRDESVCPAISGVQNIALSILISLHTVLEDMADRLQAAGIEVTEKTGGVLGAIKTLCVQHTEIRSELRSLKADMEQCEERETQTDELQSRLEVMRQELEQQKLEVAKTQAGAENTVKLQLQKMKHSLESARKAEEALRLDMETREREWHGKLQEAESREMDLRERVSEGECREEQLRVRMKEEEDRGGEWLRKVDKALRRGAEEERERSKVEIEEYREQVRQHAHTIVAMEKRVSMAEQTARETQGERDALRERLTEALSRLEDGQPTVLPEQSKELLQLEQTVASLRTSLGASQQEVVRQGEVISSLSGDLAQAHARLSDLAGELSEQQKLEVEAHKGLVVDQRMQLSMLTQKLTTATQLLEQRDEELKILSAKLAQIKREGREMNESQGQGWTDLSLLRSPHTKDVAVMVCPSALSTHRSKCKGHWHEEMSRQQKDTLSEMKQRIRSVEQKWPSKLLSQQREPVRQTPIKTQRLQNPAMQNAGSICSGSGFAFPEALRETALERMARLDMSDTLELSESTYMDLARALCEALELSEGQLSGCVPLKHLPPGERERLASFRQDDLYMFRSRLALQKTQSRDKELLLQESQREMQTLRETQVEGQRLQGELQAELEVLKQESEKLQQALQDTCNELQRERSSKVLNIERTEGRSKRVGHHNCVPNESNSKVTVLKRPRKQEMRRRRRRSEEEADVLRRQQVIYTMASPVTSLSPQQKSSEPTDQDIRVQPHPTKCHLSLVKVL